MRSVFPGLDSACMMLYTLQDMNIIEATGTSMTKYLRALSCRHIVSIAIGVLSLMKRVQEFLFIYSSVCSHHIETVLIAFLMQYIFHSNRDKTPTISGSAGREQYSSGLLLSAGEQIKFLTTNRPNYTVITSA